MERIIGQFTGEKHGALLIVLAGMHGNEPAGIQALDLVFKMLEVEPITNPGFSFVGKMIGLRGNLQALQKNTRYLKKDLNRQWTKENVARIEAQPLSELQDEDLELRQLLTVLKTEVNAYQPTIVYILDLHTTTAKGGIFTIPTKEEDSIRLALELHAPVIEGFLTGIQGTTLHYFDKKLFGLPTTALSFESGQHDEPLSVNRAVAALVNCMRSIGCVKADDVESHHDNILIEYSKGLPSMARLIQVHKITQEDEFEMLPNYENFQPVKKEEIIAKDKNGPIRVSQDGLLLMPLYQTQGDDGFFIIETVEGF